MSQPLGNCPACRKPLTDQDDVVICPECGAPYHRACYQKEGRCIFYKEHGPGFEYQNPAAEASESKKVERNDSNVVCRACGATNNASNIFCEKCGVPLRAANQQYQGASAQGGFNPGAFGVYGPGMNMQGEIDDIPKADWARYIGKSSDQYLYRMTQQNMRKSKIGVVLSAFFLGPYYFAYRKMWGWAALSFVLYILATVPTYLGFMVDNANPLVGGLSVDTVTLISQIVSFVNLAVRLVFSLFGTYLYRQNAGKKIKALRSTHPGDAEYQAALQKKGGVSIVGVVVVVLVTIALSAAITPFVWQDVLAYWNSIYSASGSSLFGLFG